MTIDCKIVFDNSLNKVYYPSETVNGHIEVSLSKATTVQAIYHNAVGKALCRFTLGTSRRRTTYEGKEEFFNIKTYCVGNGKDRTTLEAGHHKFNFSIELPDELPTAFETRNSCVRYYLNVQFETDSWFDKKFKEYFTVIKPLNLNLYPRFKLPVSEEHSETYYLCGCCVFYESKPLYTNVELPVGAYAPGQTINVRLNVNNQSNVNPTYNVQLIQQLNLTSSVASHKKTKDYIAYENSNVGSFPPQSNHVVHSKLIIPPLPPTENDLSKIYELKYFVYVEGKACGHSDFEMYVPIVIGTYPLVEYNLDDNEKTPTCCTNAVPYPQNDVPTYELSYTEKPNNGTFRPFYHVYRKPVISSLN